MKESTDAALDLAAAKTAGIGALGVGIGFAQVMEIAQSVLVSVGSIAGAILVIWTLAAKIYDAIKGRKKHHRRKTDFEGDK